MECPYCKYVNGWDARNMANIDGEHGQFYTLSNNIKAERRNNDIEYETTNIIGCPRCKKVFLA